MVTSMIVEKANGSHTENNNNINMNDNNDNNNILTLS